MEKEIGLSDGKKVTMREPKVKDVKNVSSIKNEEERELKLIANLTMLTDEELEEMSLANYRKLQEGLSSFLE